MTIIDDRKAALMERVEDFGGPLNEPAVFVQFMAQVMHESGGLRYVREIWGPTKAQKRYEGRADLGNVKPGDGKRFMGRDVIQITGRANYRALTKWVRETFGAKVDFEASPELLESPEWLGIGAIWYFLTRKGLMLRARQGNIEMVTRLVNGGLNGYADRLKWFDRLALEQLGYDNIRQFQEDKRLVPDGISGPITRAALHTALVTKGERQAKPPTPPKKPASASKPSTIKETGKAAGGGLLGGGLALGIVAFWRDITNAGSAIAAKWDAFWIWLAAFIN